MICFFWPWEVRPGPLNTHSPIYVPPSLSRASPLFSPELVDLGVITAFEASVLKDRIAGNDPATRQALSLFEATGDASLVRSECGTRWGRG